MQLSRVSIRAADRNVSPVANRIDLPRFKKELLTTWRRLVQVLAPRSLGARIAVAVNLLVMACGLGYLVLDYQREFSHRLADKSAALRRQAMTLYVAVSQLNLKSNLELQRFVDGICEKMCDDGAPAHYFVVDVDGKSLQGHDNSLSMADSLKVMPVAGSQPAARLVDKDLLIGKYSERSITVLVGERMASVLTDIRRQTLFRSVGVAAFGIVLTIGVNLAIRRLVHKPLNRLITAIDYIAAGDYGRRVGQFNTNELSHVAAAVDSMRLSLAEAANSRTAAVNRARRVQNNLLPHIDNIDGVQIAYFHRAAEDVAGDYLDVFQTSRGTTILCVADVAGHGIAPAMIAAMLKVLLLDAAEVHDDPGRILEQLNHKFAAVNLLEDFATVFLAEWRPATRTLHYVNAGHEPALLANTNAAFRFLSSTGMIVGIDSHMQWQSRVVSISPGELLTCWTDGITEARNRSDAMLGRERLVATLQSANLSTPQDIVNVIDRVVLDHCAGQAPADDCTVLAIRFS